MRLLSASWLAFAASLCVGVSGCSGSEGIPIQPGGGSSNGGNAPVGGAAAGGSPGGMAATGGSAVVTATGGQPGFSGTTSVFATGGKTNAGTTNTGAGVATGGSAPAGGAATGGKAASTGGTTNAATGGTTNNATTGGKAANTGGVTNAGTGGTTYGAASGGKSSSGGTTSGATGGTINAAANGGKSSTGGAATGGTANSGGNTGGLPRLTVNGTKLQDPNGKTIILRGSSLIDIGAIYSYGGQNATAFSSKLNKIAAAGVQGHVVRLPVYPKICYNTGGSPYCSPVPYPVGTGTSASCAPTAPLSASDYYTQVLKPAVDAATALNLYVIIDYHQIDNATTGTSAADATTFWTDIAPKFKDYANVFYEPFNEPIDTTGKSWATLKPVVQGWITTIRAAALNNVIIVPSNSWDQKPGDAASDPPTGGNLMYTAHIYASNWNTTFQNQVTTGVGVAPVFVTEWGYTTSDPNYHTWGTSLQTFIDNAGASWTAWVTDNSWTPNIFSDTALTQLTDFGSLVKSWLASATN